MSAGGGPRGGPAGRVGEGRRRGTECIFALHRGVPHVLHRFALAPCSTLIVTEECLLHPSRNPHYGKAGIEAVLKVGQG